MKRFVLLLPSLASVGVCSPQGFPSVSLIANNKALRALTATVVDHEDYGPSSVVDALIHGTGPGIPEVMKTIQSQMEVGDALQRLKGKLPVEVTSLVSAHQQETHGSRVGPFDEASLEKALKILNHMIEEAWRDLDDEIFKCKEFEDRNRGTFDQVMSDLARLGEKISDLARQRSEANENINSKEAEFLELKASLQQQSMSYMKIRWANQRELTILKNDLEVMTFVLELTKCKDGEAMLLTQLRKQPALKVCEGDEGNGDLFLRFYDPKLEDQLERKMTPRARHAVQQALGSAVSIQSVALVETDPTTTTTTTTEGLPAPPVAKTPVRERVSGKGFWKVCKKDDDVDCGLLHDTMSLEWGKFKDSVDELQHEMDKSQADFFALRDDLNSQMEILTVAKGRFMMMLAEAISNLNAEQNEQSKKLQQKNELDIQYYKVMSACKRVIAEITFNRICAVVKVRNEVMSHSQTIDITDCDVTSWVPGDCSKVCDDSCPTIFGPNDDPYKCGGWQTLDREVIQTSNQHGVKCPSLTRQKKCNQQKCPVDCEQSMWSGWSKCTKDCEGGVRGRTRSILTKPKNGGESCNTVSEEEACNSGSCDRDCTLTSWSEWGFCTMSCGGGLQERIRKVVIPTRGEGVCPKDDAAERYNEQACNMHECIGDEICISKQDLVIAIDGSGSLRTTGFDIIRDFAAELIDRYKSEYFSNAAMKIGVVMFGNGAVLDDGTVSGAVKVHKLSEDLAAVKASIKGMKWQRGFTNMAQALSMAEKMFLMNGRKEAQSAVMVITDGKPTLLYETHEKVMELKDKQVKLFFAPVTEAKGAEVALMKKWATQPWQSHFVHVPGLLPLKADGSVFVAKFIATFCPEAMSPSATATEEKSLGYFLLKESAICGDVSVGTHLKNKKANTAGDCAVVVRATGAKAFSFGQWYRKGYCYAEVFPIDDAKIAAWQMARANPDAPCDASGGWIPNSFYDTYVLETV